MPDCENSINSSNKEEDLFLSALSLYNFKNFDEVKIEFNSKIICITGENGSGKTNLLDAIYYLSMGKSAFNSQDNQNIRHATDLFSITGEFEVRDQPIIIQCALKKGEKKILKVNQDDVARLSDHLGQYPIVLVAPDDADLVREDSSARRKFIDGILCQYSQEYLSNLIEYNRYLKQRNAALKLMSEKNTIDKSLFETYDEKLIPLNTYLYDLRKDFVIKFVPYLNKNYKDISEDREQISLTHRSSVSSEDFADKFRNNFKRDLLLQRTELGVHRDDFVFKINSHGLKKFGSQGQQKSFIISLKLAHYKFIQEEKQITPILLLDDIFDKLDDGRIDMLMKMVNTKNFGQIFITDARKNRIKQILNKNKVSALFLCIQDNIIKPC